MAMARVGCGSWFLGIPLSDRGPHDTALRKDVRLTDGDRDEWSMETSSTQGVENTRGRAHGRSSCTAARRRKNQSMASANRGFLGVGVWRSPHERATGATEERMPRRPACMWQARRDAGGTGT